MAFLSLSPSQVKTFLSPAPVTTPIATIGCFSPEGKLPSIECTSRSKPKEEGSAAAKPVKKSGCSIHTRSNSLLVTPSILDRGPIRSRLSSLAFSTRCFL